MTIKHLALTLSLCAMSQLAALAEAEPNLTPGSAVPETLANIDVADQTPLKKAGATKLSVFFVEGPDGGDSKTAYLLGSKAGKIVWKQTLPLKIEVNRAKCDVLCRKGLIEVISQYPGSAAFTSQTFNWDGTKVVSVKTAGGDPSQDQVNALMTMAEKGSRSQLDAWEEKEHNVMYPGNYINQQNLETLLKRGQKAAEALDRAGKPALAAARMELCFDASQDFVELNCGGGDDEKIPSKWISAWKAECVELPPAKFAPILNDYVRYLEKCGKHKQAQRVAGEIKASSLSGN